MKSPEPERVPVVVVGAGPVGLTAGLALARLGLASVILEEAARRSEGSKAICIQRHTLEIFERLGTVAPMMAKGITWQLGRVFLRTRQLYSFRLPGSDEKFPPFINLQQSYTDDYLADALARQPLCQLRWQHKVTGLTQSESEVEVRAETPAGIRRFRADYLLGADGARSAVRKLLGLSFDGKTYPNHFLIADIRAKLDQPNERWFWFDPVFNPGRSALIHPQPDNVWRIDWQLGADVDDEKVLQPDALKNLIRQTIGDRPFEIVWATTYIFHQRLASRLRVGRVFLLGDAAHLMSPFGARGMNSGVQDADNLCWKLWLVMTGRAPATLLDSYEIERRPAAIENLRITDRSMQFITPQTRAHWLWRNVILAGSVRWPALRRFVNCGRLSTPFDYRRSPIIDRRWSLWRGPLPGQLAPAVLDWIGPHFLVLYFSDAQPIELKTPPELPVKTVVVTSDKQHLWQKYAARPGTLYLIRPDGHIAARRRRFPPEKLAALLWFAVGGRPPKEQPRDQTICLDSRPRSEARAVR
jgi:3-(3-hydroxy-phenyl)propionate hydroxylase